MIAKTEGRRRWGSIFRSSSNQEQEYSLMLPKDLLTRNSTSIWKWCTKKQNQSLKTAITSTRFKEHSIQSCLTEEQLRRNNLNQEQGSSSCLTSFWLAEGYYPTKQIFRDFVRIHYGWPLTWLSGYYVSGENLTFSMLFRITLLQLRSLLSEASKDARVEPQWQPLNGESNTPSTATGNEVRLDACAHGFWQAGQMTLFDVKVFNSKARKYAKQEAYRTIEKQKNTFTKSGPCRLKLYETYGYETFTPLVMSAMRGMRRESLKFYLCLLELINEKRKTKYCIATMWIQPKIIFALMKSIGTCIRGNQSVFQQEKFEQSIKGNFFSEVLA